MQSLVSHPRRIKAKSKQNPNCRMAKPKGYAKEKWGIYQTGVPPRTTQQISTTRMNKRNKQQENEEKRKRAKGKDNEVLSRTQRKKKNA